MLIIFFTRNDELGIDVIQIPRDRGETLFSVRQIGISNDGEKILLVGKSDELITMISEANHQE